MAWLKPKEAKLPYGDFKGGKLGNVASKIRKVLGWRLDQEGNTTVHREDFTLPNGNTVSAAKNLCMHFEQDAATADAVRITMAGAGRAINMLGVNNDQSMMNVVVSNTTADQPDILRVYQEDGTFVFRITAAGAFSTTAP